MPIFLGKPSPKMLAAQRQREAIVAMLPATALELASGLGAPVSRVRNQIITLVRERVVDVVSRKLVNGRHHYVYGQRVSE